MSHPVIYLMGPTAAGKTDLAAVLHDAFNAELISVDAAQVYRGMDIGTAKPDTEFLHAHPHHLIDIRVPGEIYDAAQFCTDARALIDEIHARGRLPVLVGGTMFCCAAREDGLSELPSAATEVRARIDEEMKRAGRTAMHARLARIDAKLAASISTGDAQRIQRMLEIHALTGQSPSEVMAKSVASPLPFPLIKLGLFTAERSVLHQRIETRFHKMLERGFVDEVQTVVASLDDPATQPCMRIVGYRQVYRYLRGEISFDAMTEQAIAATRQFAKRQLTWMRRQRNLTWLDVTEKNFAASAENFLMRMVDGDS